MVSNERDVLFYLWIHDYKALATSFAFEDEGTLEIYFYTITMCCVQPRMGIFVTWQSMITLKAEVTDLSHSWI